MLYRGNISLKFVSIVNNRSETKHYGHSKHIFLSFQNFSCFVFFQEYAKVEEALKVVHVSVSSLVNILRNGHTEEERVNTGTYST